MNFALKQMKAMGWSEGKGLGIAEDGITTAIKPCSQMDTRGFGFSIEDSIQLNNQWWSEAYDVASKGIKSDFQITSVGVVVKKKKQTTLNNEKDEKNENNILNNRFVSAGYINNSHEKVDIEKKSSKKRKRKIEIKDPVVTHTENLTLSKEKTKKKPFDFNTVFERSKGITCHKAARLGIKMDGKMKRIEQQEQEFLIKLKNKL